MSAVRLEAGTITTDKIAPTVGNELVISANPTVAGINTQLKIMEGKIESIVVEAGSRTYIQLTDPKLDPEIELKFGDYWIKEHPIEIWDNVLYKKHATSSEKYNWGFFYDGGTFDEYTDYHWQDLVRTAKRMWCYNNRDYPEGKWISVDNTDILAEHSTRITQTAEEIELQAEEISGLGESVGNLTVKANNIDARVTQVQSDVNNKYTIQSGVNITAREVDIYSSTPSAAGHVNVGAEKIQLNSSGTTIDLDNNGIKLKTSDSSVTIEPDNISISSGGSLHIDSANSLVIGNQSSSVVYAVTNTTQYSSSNSQSAPGATWQNDRPSPTAEKPYIWVRTMTTQNGVTTYIPSMDGVCESAVSGKDGKDGKTIGSVTRYYQQTSGSTPSKPTTLNPYSSWTPTYPGYSETNTFTWYTDRYLYTDNTFYYTDVMQETAASIAKDFVNGLHPAASLRTTTGITINGSDMNLSAVGQMNIVGGNMLIGSAGGVGNAIVLGEDGLAINSGGVFTIESGNFGVDKNGNVTISGQINGNLGSIGYGDYNLIVSKTRPTRPKTYGLSSFENCVWIKPATPTTAVYAYTISDHIGHTIWNTDLTYTAPLIAGSSAGSMSSGTPVVYNASFRVYADSSAATTLKDIDITCTLTSGAYSCTTIYTIPAGTNPSTIDDKPIVCTLGGNISGSLPWVGTQDTLKFSISCNGPGTTYRILHFAGGDPDKKHPNHNVVITASTSTGTSDHGWLPCTVYNYLTE